MALSLRRSGLSWRHHQRRHDKPLRRSDRAIPGNVFPGKLTFRETSVDRFTDPFSGLGNANSPMCVSVLV